MKKTIALIIIALLAHTALADSETCDKLLSQSREALKRQDFQASAAQLTAMESACPEEVLSHEKKCSPMPWPSRPTN